MLVQIGVVLRASVNDFLEANQPLVLLVEKQLIAALKLIKTKLSKNGNMIPFEHPLVQSKINCPV